MMKKAIFILFCLVINLILTGCSGPSPDETWEHDDRGLYSAELSDDGQYLLIATIDRSAQLWDFKKGVKIHNWTHAESGHSDLSHVAISKDGSTAVTTDHQTIVIWDPKTGHSTGFWQLSAYITAVSLSETGQYALVAYATRSVQLIDLESGRAIWEARHGGYIEAIQLSQDANYALIGCDDNTATLWDIKQGEKAQLWEEKTRIRHVAISPNNRFALTSAPFKTIKIWDIKSGELHMELQATPPALKFLSRPIIHATSTTFSDNEAYVLIGAPPRNLYLWSTETGSLVQKWVIPKHAVWKPTGIIVYATAISDDNSMIYAEGSNGFGYAWQVK